MSAHQGDTPTSPPGKRGDIQARQADDGSFELVVEDGDSSSMPAVDPPEVDDRPGGHQRSSAGTLRRLAGWGAALAMVAAVLVFAFSGSDEAEVPNSASEVAEGFRPYEGGDEEPQQRPASPARGDQQTAQPETLEEPDLSAKVSDEQEDEDGWEFDEDQDIVIVEEGYDDPDPVVDEDGQPDQADDSHPKVRLDGINASDLSDRIKLPAQPNLQRIPAQKLEQLRPPIRGDNLERGGGVDDDYVDDEYDDYEEHGYGDDPNGDWDEEYGEDSEHWNDGY